MCRLFLLLLWHPLTLLEVGAKEEREEESMYGSNSKPTFAERTGLAVESKVEIVESSTVSVEAS